jgi:hypothetical protein
MEGGKTLHFHLIRVINPRDFSAAASSSPETTANDLNLDSQNCAIRSNEKKLERQQQEEEDQAEMAFSDDSTAKERAEMQPTERPKGREQRHQRHLHSASAAEGGFNWGTNKSYL